MPSAAYHCDELGPLGIQLQRRGIPVVFAVIPKRVAYVEAELRKYPIAAYIIEQDDQTPRKVAEASSAIVTMNDWGDYDKFVIAGNEAGVPTYGKVEGVQDFTDADVHWERRAYQQVAHVLCQGENDYQATSGPRTVVGSTRLERIWKAPPVAERDRSVVINLNFTYGVLEDARDLWLGTVIEACDRIGIAWTISMHPAQSRPSGVTNISIEPMRHLLTKPSILVSRFSTVPFEAMARGNPFVYHNPHGEKVPTFHNPMGAFDISTSASQLAEALEKARKESDYRSRCRDFFLRQVDVDQERSSEERTAEVVAASIDSNVSS